MISNLEYYRAFYYVANLESFSAAAEQLHLTQSAISQSVKKLEDALSCKLFVRKLFDQWFLTEHCIFHPQYTVPHMGLVHSLIHQGLGIGFLPLPYAEEAAQNEGMIQLKTTTRPETRTVYLAF